MCLTVYPWYWAMLHRSLYIMCLTVHPWYWAMLHRSLCIMCLTVHPWYWAMLHRSLCIMCLTVHPWYWAMLHRSLCIMCLTAWLWFELCCTAHCASCVSQHDFGLSYAVPLTVHHVCHSMTLVWAMLYRSCASCVSQHDIGLSYAVPLTVHHVSHSMTLVWAMLHNSLCIMCLTAWLWFELCCTAHCASCVSQHDIGLSYVAQLTVHHVSHSMTLVWAMLYRSLCIMCPTAWPKHLLPYFFTLWPPGPQEDFCFPTDVTLPTKIHTSHFGMNYFYYCKHNFHTVLKIINFVTGCTCHK